MSAVTAPPLGAARDPRATAGTRPSLPRLTGVELRKMVDTRAGLWLLISTAVLTLAAVALVCIVGEPEDMVFRDLTALAVQPAALLLPIAGILLVTSEWTQRTTLITFSLVPQRGRVLAAKLLAGCLLALVAFVLSVAVAAVATAIVAPGVPDTWSLPVGILGQSALYVVVSMLGGIAFGAALLVTAPAIVLSFVLPIAWAAIGSIAIFDGAADWLDTTRTLAPMTDELFSSTQWAQAGTSLLLWVLLPLLVGAWRIVRGEVR